MEEVTYDNDYKWDPKDNQKYNSDGNTSSGYKKFNGGKTPFKPDHFIKTIYVDGGSRILDKKDGSGKKYVGAWSFYDPDTNTLEGKAEDNSTNNQMELMANIRAIEYLNDLGVSKEEWVCMKLDSDYVRFGILFWVKKWIQNDWKRANKNGEMEEVKNVDLWKRLHELVSDRKVYFEHVAGHAGIEGNEKVDINCKLLMNKFLEDIGFNK